MTIYIVTETSYADYAGWETYNILRAFTRLEDARVYIEQRKANAAGNLDYDYEPCELMDGAGRPKGGQAG